MAAYAVKWSVYCSIGVIIFNLDEYAWNMRKGHWEQIVNMCKLFRGGVDKLENDMKSDHVNFSKTPTTKHIYTCQLIKGSLR